MPYSTKIIDKLAEIYIERRLAYEAAKQEFDEARDELIGIVEKDGHTPARAVKSKALLGDDYELRVSHPAEITVDTRGALRILSACRDSGGGRIFMRLFRRVTTFTLIDGAQKVMNANLPRRAPRNLRSLFARAISVRELAPQLEIRKREKKAAA